MHHGELFRLWRGYPHPFSLRLGHARALTPHRGVIHSPRAASLPDKRACRSPSGVCEVDSTSKLAEPHLQSSVNMMHAVASYLRRDIEVVITRRSWKFASIADANISKSLVNTDFSGTPKATRNRISKNISKKFNNPMISAKAVSYTEGYRSGHNEAVLKICRSSGRQNAETPWKHWLFRTCKKHQTAHI